MNTSTVLRGTRDDWPRERRNTTSGVGLWVFMGVASMLFTLFIVAYVMRMSGADASAIAMPAQTWLSTALLVVGSVLLQRSSVMVRGGTDWGAARHLLLAAGLCALAFLGSQLWAWSALQTRHVMPAGNPAASFFYLLTAMHGLHVAGGLVGWALTMRRAWRHPAGAAWGIVLCARYWHFLLAVWLVLFATLGWLTPDVARFICGTS